MSLFLKYRYILVPFFDSGLILYSRIIVCSALLTLLGFVSVSGPFFEFLLDDSLWTFWYKSTRCCIWSNGHLGLKYLLFSSLFLLLLLPKPLLLLRRSWARITCIFGLVAPGYLSCKSVPCIYSLVIHMEEMLFFYHFQCRLLQSYQIKSLYEVHHFVSQGWFRIWSDAGCPDAVLNLSVTVTLVQEMPS